MQALLDTGERQQQAVREEYGPDARRISSRLVEEIRAARGTEFWHEDLPIAEAQDYFWVQSRLDSNSWVDLHPAWGDERAGPPSASVAATFSDQVPTELVQKVELQITGERIIGRKLESVTLLQMDPTPAANLISVPLSLMFMPVGDYKTLEDLGDVISEAELFVPTINQVPGEYVIDLRGNLVPASEAQTAMAGVFRETGRAFSEAAAALGSLDSPNGEGPRSVTALTGLWADFRIHLPGGHVREHRRTIIDGISGDRNSDQWSLHDHSIDELRDMILGTRHTLLETGHGNTAFKLDETLSYASSLAKFYKDWVSNKQGIAGAAEPEPPPIMSPSMHLALFDVFDQIETEDPTAIVYRSEPSLVTIEYKGRTSESGEVVSQTTVDVVSNERRLYVRQDGNLVPSGDDTVFLGVMETLAEGSVFPENSSPLWNAGMTTLAALDDQRSFDVLKPDSRETIDKLPISAVSARAMHRELDQGYWIVTPEMSENAAPEDHVWWRIQPETGNTLGMIHTGQGADLSEYILGFMFGFFLIVVPICTLGALPAGAYYETTNNAPGATLSAYGTCLAAGVPMAGLVGIAVVSVPAALVVGAGSTLGSGSISALTGGHVLFAFFLSFVVLTVGVTSFPAPQE
ncbi:MAG: hypothetical protein HKN13_05740 [Rhodothermales bacterium]|nr:hypothetical protein [Rhodothermales bacterium]